MLACLNLASCIFKRLTLHFVLVSYLVASFPFVACVGATPCVRSCVDDIGMLMSYLSSCLALHVRVSHISLKHVL